jgi:hypothetical protein
MFDVSDEFNCFFHRYIRNRSDFNPLGEFVYNDQDMFVATWCRMDLPGPTTSVGTRTDYLVGPWDYLTCVARYLMAWSTRTTEEKYLVRKLYMSRTV